MGAAFEWINNIASWFGQFVPRMQIIESTHNGVKFVGGNKPKVLGPGLHIYWPLTTIVHTMPVVRQTYNVISQVLVTKDGKSVSIGVVLVYKIDDVMKAIAESYDHVNTMSDITMCGVVGAVTSRTLEEMIAQIEDKVESDLTKVTRRELKPFGIYVDRCAVTDFSPCRCIKLLDGKGQ